MNKKIPGSSLGFFYVQVGAVLLQLDGLAQLRKLLLQFAAP